VSFRLEEFEAVDPLRHGIRFRIRNYSDLTDVRQQFGDPGRLLVAFTGPWDRQGSLGDSTANAWTSMPGYAPYGAVLEAPVAGNANLVAHELGHYLNLEHAHDELNVMNAIIYRRSVKLGGALCAAARQAAQLTWTAMVRRDDAPTLATGGSPASSAAVAAGAGIAR
jgi:hypothetical protein